MPIDYNRYPANWKTEIRPAVLKRAKNRCEAEGCVFKNAEIVWSVKKYKAETVWVQTLEEAIDVADKSGWKLDNYLKAGIIRTVKVVITIAHLDHDETNNDVTLDRLAAMCQLHHLRYDAKEKYRRIMNKSKSNV
jgi:hypothetical protein